MKIADSDVESILGDMQMDSSTSGYYGTVIIDYTDDPLQRLTPVDYDDGASFYTYDAVVSVGTNSYCYDHDGNMVRRTLAGSVYNLTYDAENRLTGVSGAATATFVYDGDGNRVKGTVIGVTTASVGNYYEWTGSTSTMVRYYYAGAQRVGMRIGSSTLRWLLTDHLGSTNETADGTTGSLIARLRFKPFGETRYTSGVTPTTYRFTGQRQEQALGGADGLYFLPVPLV